MTQAGEIAPGDALYVRNMRPLWRLDPRIALKIDAVSTDRQYQVERARSGAWTLRVTAGEKSPAYIHSRHNPSEEAETWAANPELDDIFCFVVAGFGLGYHLAALHRRLKGEAFIICTEPDVRMVATALAHVDLSEMLHSGKFLLFIDDDKQALHAKLQSLATLMMLGMKFLRHPSSRTAGEAHEQINRSLTEFVSYTRMSLTTLMANSQVTCRNVAMNLRHTVVSPSIDELKDRFHGVPGIVVSAGPSLGRNIDELSSWKGKGVICAVQTAVRPLMSRGIAPDFITTLDFHEMSRKFFEDVGDLRSTHLIAEPKASWAVLDHYPGPIWVLDNSWARLIVGDQIGARGGLPAGATVAHLAFYFALHLGCDPIIFVGQDLAFTGHVFYTPGVEIHRAWRNEINRFQSLEAKEWERIARNRPILRTVTGVHGDSLYTDELLFTYLEQFEKDIAACGRTVVNATEGGSSIRGTVAMSLREAAAQFAAPLETARLGNLGTPPLRQDKLQPAAHEIRRRIEELSDVAGVADELKRLFTELESLVDKPDQFNRRLIRVDELRSRIHRDSKPYKIINAAVQLIEFRRFSADRRIELTGATGPDRARRQIARDREFIDGVRAGALEVKKILEDSLARVACAISDAGLHPV